MRRLLSILMVLILSPMLASADAFDGYVKEPFVCARWWAGAVIIANGYKRASSIDAVVTLAREIMEKTQELAP